MVNGRIHNLKLDRLFVDDVLNGVKRFEVRLNDRNYQVGDLIKFTPYPYLFEEEPIKEKTYKITYILSNTVFRAFVLQPGFVVLGIEEVK